MQKTIEKPTAKKKSASNGNVAPKSNATPKSKTPENGLLEKVSHDALKKLKSLNSNQQLQADIEWCLGSYSFDKNPAGLTEMAKQALQFFQEEKTKNSKAIPVKLIADLEKATKN